MPFILMKVLSLMCLGFVLMLFGIFIVPELRGRSLEETVSIHSGKPFANRENSGSFSSNAGRIVQRRVEMGLAVCQIPDSRCWSPNCRP